MTKAAKDLPDTHAGEEDWEHPLPEGYYLPDGAVSAAHAEPELPKEKAK